MRYFKRNLFRTGIIGAFVVLILFGCASVKEMNVGQKYEASKSWFKEKWNAMGSKSSSSKDVPTEAFANQNRPDYFKHTVQWPGETLSLIAKWYTGRYGNWKALAKANPGLNPNRIVVGDIINIPTEMLKSKEPLPHKVAAKSLSSYYAHTVRNPDETLADIAKWYTGNPGNAKLLAKANPDIDPEFLLVGIEIFIPSNLLKTRKPFDKNSIQASTSKTVKKPSVSKNPDPISPAAKPKKIQLFGPKKFPAN